MKLAQTSCFAALATVLVYSAAMAAADTDRSAPNIVLIMSDDMGFSDIGCYGGEINTPTLDRLADRGLRFTQFYNTARCCPTRAALLTGVYQHQAGIGLMTGNRNLPGYRGDLGRNVLTIAEALGTANYRAYMSGKWHVTRFTSPDGPKDNWPLQRAFAKFYGTITGAGSFYDPATLCRDNTYITPANDPEYRPETYYYTDAISDNATMFLGEHAKQSLEGVSLRPTFSGGSLERTDALYFEHHLNCAVRDGDWKLVRKGQPGNPSKLFAWELYDMSQDRSELNDLSAKHPDKVAELSARWEAWAERAQVKPWPWNFE